MEKPETGPFTTSPRPSTVEHQPLLSTPQANQLRPPQLFGVPLTHLEHNPNGVPAIVDAMVLFSTSHPTSSDVSALFP